jgi:cytochrome c biogenesis protein CcmG/thiol:disulfide interchange protein DsbE
MRSTPSCRRNNRCLSDTRRALALTRLDIVAFRSGVVVLGISLDWDENAYRTFLERFRVDFETARDPARVVSTRYGTARIPETYIIDRSGVVAGKVISNRDWMDPGILRFVKSLVR